MIANDVRHAECPCEVCFYHSHSAHLTGDVSKDVLPVDAEGGGFPQDKKKAKHIIRSVQWGGEFMQQSKSVATEQNMGRHAKEKTIKTA